MILISLLKSSCSPCGKYEVQLYPEHNLIDAESVNKFFLAFVDDFILSLNDYGNNSKYGILSHMFILYFEFFIIACYTKICLIESKMFYATLMLYLYLRCYNF